MASAAHESVCSNQELPTVLNRRPANYEHQTWDYNSICSMQQQQQEHGDDKHMKQISLQTSLKQRVRQILLDEEKDLATRLRIMEQLQSLGIAYHFEEEIKKILMSMHEHDAHLQLKHDLSSTALLFRMLRGYGIPASAGMLIGFRDDNGNNIEDTNSSDIKGYKALIEASYLAFPGEDMLDKARAFAVKKQELVTPISMEPASDMEIHRDLLVDLPLHWRAPRLQAISSLKQHLYNNNGNNKSFRNIDPSILQLAAIDFNLVQAIHGEELVEVTKWWKDTGLGEKLSFARDRLVECFFCAVCIAPEPLLVGCREVLAKVGALIIHLDDIYDLYGTMDELAAFTDAMGSSWDDDASLVARLPEYMKVMFSAIRSMSKVAADRLMKEQGHDVLPLYKKAWHELCMAFLLEAKWQHEETMPCLEEYLDNGWVTSTGPLLLLHALTALQHTQEQNAYSLLGNHNDNDGEKTSMVYPKLVELCSRIFRLSNDCATHDTESEQGEAASAITCYMKDNGGYVRKEESRAAMVDAMAEIWKEVNKEVACGDTIMDEARSTENRICVNLARIIQCLYQDGDGITLPKESRKQQVKDLLFTPIKLGISSAR